MAASSCGCSTRTTTTTASSRSVFDGAGRFVAAVLRLARRPKGREIAAHLRRLIRAMREHWPRVEILLRGDGHYRAPEVLDFRRAQGVDFILGLPTTSVLTEVHF